MASTFPSYQFPDVGISNAAALQAILKEFYGPQQIKILVYRRNKAFAMLHKEEDWAGEIVPIPVVIANPAGTSRTMLNLTQNAGTTNQVTASKVVKFFMGWTQDYALVSVTNLVQLMTRNDSGGFLKAIQREMNGALKAAENKWAGALFRKSTGTIGQASGTVSGAGVITLLDPMAVTQFEYGQTLEATTTDGGAAIGAPAYGYVVGVDRQNALVTVAATQGGAGAQPAGWTAASLFFRIAGDGPLTGATTLNQAPNGFADWLPTTAPGGTDSFNAVNRSVDVTRLAGIRWNGANQSIEEALVDAAALTAREDGNPELALTNHTTFAGLAKALGAKREYVNFEHDEVAGVGFSGMRIHGADEEINIFADRSCPGKLVYGIDPDSWTLGSMKPIPHILSELDGLTELRDPNNDATQIRVGAYAMYVTDAPGHNFVASVQV